MTLTFLSNYLNHHQIPFCNEMYRLLGDKFHFVQTMPMEDERIKLGWGLTESYPYLLHSYLNENTFEKAFFLAYNSDVVLIGAAPMSFAKRRIREGKLTFIYSERFIRKGIYQLFDPRTLKALILGHTIYRYRKNVYILCASAYTSYDSAIIFAYPKRRLKWGYFPEVKKFEAQVLFEKKIHKKVQLLWVGRFLNLKHADDAIEIARRLKKENYRYKLSIIGLGEQESYLKCLVTKLKLDNEISFLGQMKPEEVRDEMEQSNIFLFTSDFNEGWGVVLNEAMNSGCAVVASHAIGSVNFLINDGVNGLIYQNGDMNDFYSKVKILFDQPEMMKNLGINAIKTILNMWNPEIAARRLVLLSKAILTSNDCNIFESGPCSQATIIKNNWYKSKK